MTADELKEMREQRRMTGVEFGGWIAHLMGAERPYTRQEVNAWETGRRPIPATVELALLRAEVERLRKRG